MKPNGFASRHGLLALIRLGPAEKEQPSRNKTGHVDALERVQLAAKEAKRETYACVITDLRTGSRGLGVLAARHPALN